MILSAVEGILHYERDFFLWLNDRRAGYWDVFMWIYSGKLIWLPLVIAVLGVFVYKVKWQEAALLILAAVLVGVLCDQISSSLVKPFFERLRPTHHPDFADVVQVVNGYRGGRLGFVSSHATNGFGVAVFSSLLFRYRPYTIAITLWALINCYTRIYLGVHFVSDIVGGMILGSILGLITYYLYLAARVYILKVPYSRVKVPVLEKERAQILVGAIITLVICIAIYSAIWDIPQ